MKKLLLTIALVIGFTMNSQITFSFYQDAKLAFQNDGHGNDPFTADVTILSKWYNGGLRPDHWSKQIFVYPSFEYADLNHSRYIRIALGVGYRFRIWKIDLEPSIDYGFIDRWGGTTQSFNALVELTYRLTERINLGFLLGLTERTDLLAVYGTTKPTQNFAFGFKYELLKVKAFRTVGKAR